MATDAAASVATALPAGRRVCPECGAVFTVRKRGGSPLCRLCLAKQQTAYLYHAVEHRDRRRKRHPDGPGTP